MKIVETHIFTRRVLDLLTDDEYRLLQHALMLRPDLGQVIPGSGGLRKARGVSRDGVDEVFAELLESVRQGGAILKGEKSPARSFETDAVDVKHIRERFGLSQRQFAALLGISVDTLQNWEQGRRRPRGPAQVLLRVAARHPEAVWDVARSALTDPHQT